jgi:hypothetical protein
MQRKQSQRVSGNAVEFGEGSISHEQGVLPMIAGPSGNHGKRRKFPLRRIYQLGIQIPDARRESSHDTEAGDS